MPSQGEAFDCVAFARALLIRAGRATVEEDAARFDLAWLISAINVHRHLPRPTGPDLSKWYAENDRWLREASDVLTKIHNARAAIDAARGKP